MKRLLAYTFNDAIECALSQMPSAIATRLSHVDYLCGVHPAFVGLHNYGPGADGRSYGNTAHVAWMMHQSHLPIATRATTVVLPRVVGPKTIAHELGHVLHEQVGLDFMVLVPVTDYAQTDRLEAFAEAFTAWLGWYGPEVAHKVDEKTLALFTSLGGIA